MKRSRKALAAVLVLYWVVLTLYMVAPGGAPGTALAQILPGRDLTAHAVALGVLAFLLCLVIEGGKRSSAAVLAFSIIVALAYAVSVELVQTLLPRRTGSLSDIAASIPGILLACGGWLILRRLVPSPHVTAWVSTIDGKGTSEARGSAS